MIEVPTIVQCYIKCRFSRFRRRSHDVDLLQLLEGVDLFGAGTNYLAVVLLGHLQERLKHLITTNGDDKINKKDGLSADRPLKISLSVRPLQKSSR